LRHIKDYPVTQVLETEGRKAKPSSTPGVECRHLNLIKTVSHWMVVPA